MYSLILVASTNYTFFLEHHKIFWGVIVNILQHRVGRSIFFTRYIVWCNTITFCMKNKSSFGALSPSSTKVMKRIMWVTRWRLALQMLIKPQRQRIILDISGIVAGSKKQSPNSYEDKCLFDLQYYSTVLSSVTATVTYKILNHYIKSLTILINQ